MARKFFAFLVAAAFFYIASPLVYPIAMGGVLAVLFFPWLERLEKKKLSTAVGSALLTLGITVLLIFPTSLLTFIVAKSGFYQIQAWRSSPVSGRGFFDSILSMPKIHSLMDWVSTRVPLNTEELARTFQELGRMVGARMAELLGGVITHLPVMMIALVVIVVSTYFFLIDGRKIVIFFRTNSIFSRYQTDQLIGTIGGMCRSVILASVVSGGIQALVEVFACVLTGTPNVALIGLLVFVASFIPLVGSSPVTLIVALQQVLEGNEFVGAVLLVVAFVIIGIDNTVRPLFLRGSANLHPFLAFVAAIGGLQTLGFLGVFLGPIMAALFIDTVEILTHAKE